MTPNYLSEAIAAVDFERPELISSSLDANRSSTVINSGIAPSTVRIVMVQPEIVLCAGTIANIIHPERVDVLVGTILPMRDATVVAEATPAEGRGSRAAG